MGKLFSTVVTTLFLSLQCNALDFLVHDDYPGVLLVEGLFEKEDLSEFTTHVLEHNIDTVMLISEGGNLVSSIEIGYFIREQKLNTIVPEQGYCYSACTYAFMGGVKRSIDSNAVFAMHRPYFVDKMPGEYIKGYNAGIVTSVLVVTYLIEMGLDPLTASSHLINEQLAHFNVHQQKELNIITAKY